MAIFGYFLLLILITSIGRLGSRYFSGKTIYLLRALLPSWKFFDDAGDYPKLFYLEEAGIEWKPVLETPPRKWRHLLCNPQGAYLLACGSLLQQLVTDLEESHSGRTQSLEDSVSYQLVQRLVEQTLSKKGISHYQFKICSISSLNFSENFLDRAPEDVLISPYYKTLPGLKQ